MMHARPAPVRTLIDDAPKLARAITCPRCPKGILCETRLVGVVSRLDCPRCEFAMIYRRSSS
jgi:hypothetical protein